VSPEQFWPGGLVRVEPALTSGAGGGWAGTGSPWMMEPRVGTTAAAPEQSVEAAMSGTRVVATAAAVHRGWRKSVMCMRGVFWSFPCGLTS
jgi:hypothetical protein